MRVDDDVKALWVEAAYGERVSLSEWLRRAAAVRLNNGAVLAGRDGAGSRPSGDGVADQGVPGRVAPVAASRPASPEPAFRPDFKGKQQ